MRGINARVGTDRPACRRIVLVDCSMLRVAEA
jgi:hypothetical protein